MASDEETSDVGDGGDGDTEEFAESDLAPFVGGAGRGAAGENAIPAWARLVSIDKSYPNVELRGEEVSVGRSDVLKTKGKEDSRVSKVHVKIWSSPDEESYAIQNLSVNGTLVQGVAVGKDQRVPLHQGDEICLGPNSSGCPTYVFQLLNGVKHGQQNTALAVVDAAVDNVSGDNQEENDPAPKRIKLNGETSSIPAGPGDSETFKCSICLNIWYDVVSVTPCLHSFCNACISNWYRKAREDRTECRCPQCRVRVTSVGRNHMLRGLVEDYLHRESSLDRSPEEKTELDKLAIFDSGHGRKFNFGTGHDDDHEHIRQLPRARDSLGDPLGSSDSDDQSQDHGEYCIQCSRLNDGQDDDGPVDPGRFRCAPGQVHFICHTCGLFFPRRRDIEVPQTCQSCSMAFCKMYYTTQNEDPAYGSRCREIIPLNARTVSTMPVSVHRRNAYEQEVTTRYMAEQGLSFDSVLVDWLRKLDAGEAGQPTPQIATMRSHSAVCDTCAELVHGYLLDQFRRQIPRTELPPEAASRPDCWWGDKCRTQYHKDGHARKFNHVCDPARPNTAIGAHR